MISVIIVVICFLVIIIRETKIDTKGRSNAELKGKLTYYDHNMTMRSVKTNNVAMIKYNPETKKMDVLNLKTYIFEDGKNYYPLELWEDLK